MNKSTEQTIHEFRQWRSQPKPGRVPHHLKEQALKLSDEYTASELSAMLGVTSRSINNWRASHKPKEQSFITLPDIQAPPPRIETYTVSLRLPNKVEIIFNDQPLSKIIAFTKAIEN